jgi:RiboL-PSP-HEPN
MNLSANDIKRLERTLVSIIGNEVSKQAIQQFVRSGHPVTEPFVLFVENMDRLNNLIELYEANYGDGSGRRLAHKSDILRAAVVLLHAALEDYLRSIAKLFYPRGNRDALNSIPLVGINDSNRPEKFSLGALEKFRGQTIDYIIDQSISTFLDKTSFNDSNDITSLLTRIGIDPSSYSKYYPVISEMIVRRHNIVHRADRNNIVGRGQQHFQSLGISPLQKWKDGVEDFIYALTLELQTHSQ